MTRKQVIRCRIGAAVRQKSRMRVSRCGDDAVLFTLLQGGCSFSMWPKLRMRVDRYTLRALSPSPNMVVMMLIRLD